MKLKNVALFNELDNLVSDIMEKNDYQSGSDIRELNEDLGRYAETIEFIESGNIPESQYESYDSEETLKELISIAKELLK